MMSVYKDILDKHNMVPKQQRELTVSPKGDAKRRSSTHVSMKYRLDGTHTPLHFRRDSQEKKDFDCAIGKSTCKEVGFT